MSALSKSFQSQWRDLTNSPYIASKREKGSGKRRQISAQRSAQLVGVLLVAFFFILSWQYYVSQVDDMDYETRRRREDKFAIVTYETRDVTFWRESLENKFTYARRHGYEVYPFFQKPKQDDEGGVWSKIILVNETLETGKFEWVLWMDFDSLFTNLSSKMEDFMENAKNHLKEGQRWEDVAMIAASDCHIFNAGIIFFRESEWTHWFLDTVWNERDTPQLSEQGVMKSVLERLNEFEDSKHFVKIPQYMLSAYPEEISCHEDGGRPWQPGDWIIHFPGAWSVLKESKDPFGDLLRKYWPFIVE